MITIVPGLAAIEASPTIDPYERVLGWRVRNFWARSGQASLVAGLSWLSSDHRWVAPWLAATILINAVESGLSARLLARGRTRAGVVWVSILQALSATSFAGVGLLLAQPPTPVRLAEAVLVLCAACLNNAMMCYGSRRATALLVAPSAATLMAGPIFARLLGYPVPIGDATMMMVAGVIFTVFIVRMAGAFYARSQALKAALDGLARHSELASAATQEAMEGRRRWRMIFEHSPVARVCFNAQGLFEALDARGELAGARLGERARERLGSVAAVFANIRLLEASRAAEALCGDLAGPHFTEASFDAFCQALNDIRPDGELPPFPAELIRADGERLEVEVHFRIAPDQEAPWSLCLGTYVDVTDARRAAREQAAAREAADAANRAKSDFLAVMSHEIRTPLNGVLGMAQAMAADRLSQAQRKRLQVIGESGAALLAIVDDLLDLAKIEAGGLTILTEDCDLSELVEGVHAAYAAEAQAKGLNFRLDLDPGVTGRYGADAGRVRQILGALVSNAIKFTHSGEVLVRLSRTAQGVRLEVRDTGIGIPEDRVAGLFEVFAQADSSKTRRYGGAGLGLTLCRHLARAMGGEVSVCSTPGRGSTFSVELPLVPSRPALPAAPPPAAEVDGPLRVLAAEDNPVNQTVLKALLAQIGVEPTVVENGLEALEAWETGQWDVILMDIQMPRMDGLSAARAIRAREAELGHPPTPIIAVTANAMTHQIDAYRAAGMCAVVSKPINVEALFSALLGAVAGPQVQPAEADAA
ncbi:MAG: response regulator [Proteobacteria bacterium]|nr:response regulator [Pseudomonadota bacterium]